MAVSITFGRELPSRPSVSASQSAFRMLVVGDFGAGRSKGVPCAVDRDDLDQVMNRLDVGLHLQLRSGDPVIEIRFSELEDFHPDRLFQRLDLFSSLRSRRERLLDPSTCQQEIAAILASRRSEVPAADAAGVLPDSGLRESGLQEDRTSPPQPDGGGSADLLSKVLSVTQASQKPLEQQILEGTVDWDEYVRQLVAPHVVAAADPRQSELLTGVDLAIAETMRAILHHPDYQSLEAAWLGLNFLTRRLETDRTLRLFVMDLSADELAKDLNQSDDASATEFYKLLVESVSVAGAEPWSLVMGNYQFGMNLTDCRTLARLAKICDAAGTAFVGGALPSVAGCPGFHVLTDPRQWQAPDEESLMLWNILRTLPESRRLCLALPRLMARRPYGADTNQIESFSFTELQDETRHREYLWMNGAFGIACLAGQMFSRDGWPLPASLEGEIERLPLHWYEHDGEDIVKPGAEQELNNPTAETLAGFGLTVVRSVRDQDSVVIFAVRSLSEREPAWTPGS